MIYAISFCMVGLLSAVIARHIGLPKVNPIAVFVAVWGPLLIVASLPSALGQPLRSGFWVYPWLALTGVIAGSVMGWWVRGRSPRRGPESRPFVQIRPEAAVARVHVILTLVLVGYAGLQIYNVLPLVSELGGWNAVLSTAGGEFKYAQTAARNAAISEGLEGGVLVGVMGYLLFMGHLALFTGAWLWTRGRPLLAIAPLAIAAAYSLLSLQRTSFVMCAFLFLFALVGFRWLGLARRSRSTVVVLIGGAIAAAAVILIPLQARNEGTTNSTGLQSIQEYLLSGIVGLNARLPSVGSDILPPPLESGTISTLPGLGAHTFTGLFTLLQRLGLSVPDAPHALDYYMVRLGEQTYPTNTATALADYWFDYSWWGVLFLPAILAALGTVAARRIHDGRIGWTPVYAFAMSAIAWSFFVNAILGDVRYAILVVVGCIVLPRLLVRNGREGEGPTGSEALARGMSAPRSGRERGRAHQLL